jgi:hypothetical protein
VRGGRKNPMMAFRGSDSHCWNRSQFLDAAANRIVATASVSPHRGAKGKELGETAPAYGLRAKLLKKSSFHVEWL